MKIARNAYVLPVRKTFADMIDSHLVDKSGLVVLRFRDPSYTADSGGGYHPVEVRVGADGKLVYVTDFAFCGGPFPELVKELDFDFGLGLFQQFGVDYPIVEGRELFRIFQDNFVAYHAWGVFEVTVEEER